MERDSPVRDAEYLESLSDAVHKGVRYGVEVLAVGEERAAQVPLAVIVQARLAARLRIPLQTALRRYLAVEQVFSDFALEEAGDLGPSHLRAAMTAKGAAFQRLVAIVIEEYEREVRARPPSHEARLVERVRRLLAGELADPSILEYDLDGHHLGLVSCAPDVRGLLRRLAGEVGCRGLVVAPSGEELWAWLGSPRDPVDVASVRDWLATEGDPRRPVGIGEPKSGRNGWRLTHEQARSSVWVARARSAPVAEYTEAALVASIGRDTVLTTSLQESYLAPLAEERDGGQGLRKTLRAYFRAEENCSSAAAALGVSRQTVANRIQVAEKRLDKPLRECADALRMALSLEELGRLPLPRDSRP